MASVVALDPMFVTVCPGEPVLITATTDPPDEPVEGWLLDGQPRQNSGPDANVFQFVSTSTDGATRTLTAQLGGTSQSSTI